ncbi:MAG: anthranilate phosphoribosyltransferase family protein [Xenococcaceae cyanobacterium MO_207.B15]|nr:anthranilate phosphoribosyltransferase family protein [Xenococcaceae cyanobacterium MO_207.B15]
MSDRFRELLKKVGSGTHTSKSLTREEATQATVMMLQQQATPAQIGAFMIAHRIKRPTSEELAGMLDAYHLLGKKISVANLKGNHPPVCFGNPYDGRSRTVPVMPITSLILSAADIPIILHGGDSMPTKYGLSLLEIWQQLGIDFSGFSLVDIETCLATTGIGFVYLPQHFPEAYSLIPYREQIGKRPPFATIELIWCPVQETIPIICGFVHPPTEERIRETFALREVKQYTTVKGLEGSCDLSRNRTAIIGSSKDGEFERLIIHPRDYNLDGKDLALTSNTQAIEEIQAVIKGKSTQLTPSAILNGGFYLWHLGICPSLNEGLTLAEELITKGEVAAKFNQLQSFTITSRV